ncbi:sodium-dependent organic anion transporter-like [Centruroides vittatus]|uniref:sodium-dependent organic anion transporter-like n=1 Tax=Centruroides vittatus TaxID=120091 RepID=UPI00350FD7B1
MKNNTTEFIEYNSTSNNITDVEPYAIPNLKLIHDVLLTMILIIVMVTMGACIYWRQIWEHVRRPVGPIIGLCSQFIIMPLLGYIFNKIFQFESTVAAGLLIISCCPGGAISNTFTYYVDGDVSLSITMTTISTVLALGMMPLNVWIYAKDTEASKLVIPYLNMALSLITITSPVLLGMLLKWKVPKVSVYVTKCGSVLGLVLIVVVFVLEFILFSSALLRLTWKHIVTSVLMPLVGILIGFFTAFLFRRPIAVCKTIGIESGIQNVAVSFSVISLSFDIVKYPTLIMLPFLYGISQMVICSVICFIHQIILCSFKTKEPVDIKKVTEIKDVTSL